MTTKLERLKNKLIETFGYSEEELSKLNVKELENMLSAEDSTEVEIKVVEQNTDDSELDPEEPSRFSPEWSDFVLSKFKPDELIENSPKVDGLRRVSQELLGPIVKIKTKLIQTPTDSNNYRASAIVTVKFDTADYGVISFDGAGECSPQNAEPDFAKFSVSLAETRAEGRAYRKALNLRVASAEEITKVKLEPSNVLIETQRITPKNAAITDTQKASIKVLLPRLGIDLSKFAPDLDGKTYDEAVSILEQLSSYRGNPDLIPQEYKKNDEVSEEVSNLSR